MAKMYYDSDADLGILQNETVAIIGYGSQGHAQAQNLRSNQVVDKLLGYAKGGVNLAAAGNCGGIHGNTHVNVNDPNVTNNGKHSNVHTNNHGDSCRY